MNNIEKIQNEISVLHKEGDSICKQFDDLEEQRKKLSSKNIFAALWMRKTGQTI